MHRTYTKELSTAPAPFQVLKGGILPHGAYITNNKENSKKFYYYIYQNRNNQKKASQSEAGYLFIPAHNLHHYTRRYKFDGYPPLTGRRD